jgi:uncharacterized protein YydD (DUF2326 family)
VKFSSLYSNKDDIFPRIQFRKGFNVIFAQVKDPQLKDRDSHNLGKTFLITVLDFALLGSIEPDHAFRQHKEIFDDFVFYLEIETHFGLYITVRREVKANSTIGLHVSSAPGQDLVDLPMASWTYSELSLSKAKTKLNDMLSLKAIAPFPYRKGLGYFMRRQNDYDEVFRISKFQGGADKYWKPFVSLLLGLDQELIDSKYLLDDKVKKLDTALVLKEEEAGSKSAEYDEVKGLLALRTSSLEKLRNQVDRFSFRELEATISQTAVNEIESKIADLNEQRYTIDYELQEIEKSLKSEFEFDVKRISSIFEEASLVFPEALVHEYEDLIEFNRRMTKGRTVRLKKLKDDLSSRKVFMEEHIEELDKQRQSALTILREKETLDKYRELQRILIDQEREVIALQQRLATLDQASDFQHEIEDTKQEISQTVAKIQDSIRRENATYDALRSTFSDYAEQVLSRQALISVVVNAQGNLDFNVRTLDRDKSGRETSESKGTSYKKIMCACFDLALLTVYATLPFYHFVYHDGIFEGLDNRKKVNLLNLIRGLCDHNNLQYILTVIDSDLPRDERDQKLLFTEEEIIRRLHDRDAEGRLFRTVAF